MNGLLLVNKLDDDLEKYQINDILKREEERLSNLDDFFVLISIGKKRKVGLFSLINKMKTITIIVEK